MDRTSWVARERIIMQIHQSIENMSYRNFPFFAKSCLIMKLRIRENNQTLITQEKHTPLILTDMEFHLVVRGERVSLSSFL